MKKSSTLTLGILSTVVLLLSNAACGWSQQQETTASGQPTVDQSRAEDEARDAAEMKKGMLAVLHAQRQQLLLTKSAQSPEVEALDARIQEVEIELSNLNEAKATAEQAKVNKLNQEIADLQARKAEKAKPNPEDRILPIDERIKALQAVVEWDRSNGSVPRTGLFEFGGGQPLDLIRAASERFHLPWPGIVTLPVTQDRVRVPPFTVFVRQPNDILLTYNWMAESDPSLGKWNWQNDAENPDVLIFEAPRNDPSKTPESEPKVKAFSVAGIEKEKWNSLVAEITEANAAARNFIQVQEVKAGLPPDTERMDGTILGINEGTKVLVAVGPQSYIDMVESILWAFEANRETISRPESQVVIRPGASSSSP
jgi:hypothetical protein